MTHDLVMCHRRLSLSLWADIRIEPAASKISAHGSEELQLQATDVIFIGSEIATAHQERQKGSQNDQFRQLGLLRAEDLMDAPGEPVVAQASPGYGIERLAPELDVSTDLLAVGRGPAHRRQEGVH